MKSRLVCTFKLTPLFTTFLNGTKLSGYSLGIKFDCSVLVAEESNYTNKFVNFYIAFDLDTWPKNPLRNFTLKNCFLGATNTVERHVKERFVYSSYGISFGGAGDWSFNNNFARKVIIVHHLILITRKIIVFFLDEGPTYGINGSYFSV